MKFLFDFLVEAIMSFCNNVRVSMICCELFSYSCGIGLAKSTAPPINMRTLDVTV